MLSRFRTPKQQKETIAKIEAASGLVIGTHRVLSKDVKFSDLGLVWWMKSSASACATKSG